MKKLSITLIIVMFMLNWSQAQVSRYMLLEFIKVETGQMYDFIEYKDFMEKVYQAAVNNKKIIGWDFWSLQSGADIGEFQYITITYFKDPVSMMNGISDDDLVKYAMIAYPHLDDKQVRDLFARSLLSRDLA